MSKTKHPAGDCCPVCRRSFGLDEDAFYEHVRRNPNCGRIVADLLSQLYNRGDLTARCTG